LKNGDLTEFVKPDLLCGKMANLATTDEPDKSFVAHISLLAVALASVITKSDVSYRAVKSMK